MTTTCKRCDHAITDDQSSVSFPNESFHLADCEPPLVFLRPRRLTLADKIERLTTFERFRQALCWFALGVLMTALSIMAHHIIVVAK